MKRAAAILATLPLGACAHGGEEQAARALNPTEQQVLAYVVENWDSYMHRRLGINRADAPAERLLGLRLLSCSDAYFAMDCTLEVTLAKADGGTRRATIGGAFGFDNGRIAEIIVVG